MIKPYGKNILIEPAEKKQVLIGEDGTKCEYGTVIAIGDSVEDIKVGDVVGFTVWGTRDLTIDDKKYYFLYQDDRFLLGKIVVRSGLAS